MASIGIILALFINILIYSYYQVKIMQQKTRNSYLQTTIDITNNRLKPINEFENRMKIIKQQLELIKTIEDKRDDQITLFQNLSKVTPEHIYFSQIDMAGMQITFNGNAASPLYIADFIDRLRNNNGIFKSPILRSNNTSNGDVYSFVISAGIESNLVAELNHG